MRYHFVTRVRTLRIVWLTLVVVAAFAASARAQNFTLTVHTVGPNSGRVGIIPGGGLCDVPSTCTYSVASGAAVRMTANAIPGQVPGRFSAGTGPASACSVSTCAFTMTGAAEVTVTFEPSNGPVVSITTSLAGDGQGTVSFDNSRCQNFDPPQGTQCVATYIQGSVVGGGAAPASGSRFSGFSGTGDAAACGTSATCLFALNANATITGTFHALTSLALSPSTATRFIGQAVTLTANGTFSNGVTEPIFVGEMGTWRTRAVMPNARSGISAAAAGGHLYAMGGGTASPGNLVHVYNPGANSWSAAATMLSNRDQTAAVTVNGLIYLIGGLGSGGAAVGTLDRYDPVANAWTSLAPMPTARGFLGAGVINGIIYAVGGITAGSGGTVLPTVEAYDPATNTWTTRASLPTARRGLAVGVVHGILYATGGLDESATAVPTVTAYDPATNTWSTKASLPGPLAFHGAAVVGDALYTVGGNTFSVYMYDAARDTWGMKSGLPTARQMLGVSVLDGSVYAVGGHSLTGTPAADSRNQLEVFTDVLVWGSSAPSVARVTQQGQANALAAGAADITASVGSLTCANACARLTVSAPPTMSLDKTGLAFAATSTGTGFSQQTQGQVVQLTQSNAGTVTWTATPAQPWITVSPASGTGTATLTIGVQWNSFLPSSGGVNSQINFAFSGSTNASASIAVSLNIVAAGASTAPTGAIETPLDNATNVSGSIAVSGWAIDDLEVTRVRILRDPVAGESAGAQVFIGNAAFVDGARPDVAGTFPGAPRNTRAGWGYLLLTNFLPSQGNGTVKLYAYADDADGHTTLLGTRTITCDNAGATRPFGAIDTPGQGDVVSGTINNFGWVLSRGTRRADPPSGGTVNVLINGVSRGAPSGWVSRPDLTTLFPVLQYEGVNNALGVFGFDTTTLTNGAHTIAWIVTDNQGGIDGVGSRFFTVSNGASLVAADAGGAGLHVRANLSSVTLDTSDLPAKRGFDLDAPLTARAPDGAGRVTIDGEELDRFEVALDTAGTPAMYVGYLRAGDELWPLPIGSDLNQSSGVFSWQPGVAFVGSYDFAFVRADAAGSTRREVRIVLHPKGSARPVVMIDLPGQEEVVQPFVVAGWAADPAATSGTGVGAVHVWAYPVLESCDGSACDPLFLGAAAYGGSRPDVAAVYGDHAKESGFGITIDSLPPGTYDIAVFGWSTTTREFAPAKVVRVRVK
jgi:N-acetylneuraminic acid mutarotase